MAKGNKANEFFLNGPSIEDLDHVVRMLNDKSQPDARAELIRLVTKWRDSGPNLQKMLQQDHVLWSDLQGCWEAEWLPSEFGHAKLAMFPDLPPGKMGEHGPTPEGAALLAFRMLTDSPEGSRLSGPCKRKQCGNYFLRKRARSPDYCSRRCCQLASATAWTKRRLDDEHKEKIVLVETAGKKWLKARTKDEWAEWVCKAVPGITKKFLTRAINKHEIVPPTKGG